MRVSESIRKLRKDNDLTQEQFGAIAGVSPMAVSQWENGRAVPRMGAIQRLADYFDIPKSRIMGDELEHELILSTLSDDETELVGIMRSITPEGQKLLVKYARSVALSYPRE